MKRLVHICALLLLGLFVTSCSMVRPSDLDSRYAGTSLDKNLRMGNLNTGGQIVFGNPRYQTKNHKLICQRCRSRICDCHGPNQLDIAGATFDITRGSKVFNEVAEPIAQVGSAALIGRGLGKSGSTITATGGSANADADGGRAFSSSNSNASARSNSESSAAAAAQADQAQQQNIVNP